jgi:protein-disulfide isomerase
MNPRYFVAAIFAVAILIFSTGYLLYKPQQLADSTIANAITTPEVSKESESTNGSALVRPYSPIIGPEDAPVTIVEFFDPGCEACRAFYPIVKEVLANNPEKVRLVLRYAAFHDGSDTVIKILESARRQDKFIPVLEALLEAQPQWASHHRAQLEYAWQAAESGGLDRSIAEQQIKDPAIIAILKQEADDIKKINVNKTPTFFVNGMPLMDFSANGLQEMVSARVGMSP